MDSIQYLKNKNVLQRIFNSNNTTIYKKLNVDRAISINKRSGVTHLEYSKDSFSTNGIKIHPEFFAYTYFLDGCPRLLLNYIIFYRVNMTTCEFVFNQNVVDDFIEYCNIIEGVENAYKVSVVKSALSTLVNHNIIDNRKQSLYMINPVICGGTTTADRRELIKKYSINLINSNKNVIAKFYPRCRK